MAIDTFSPDRRDPATEPTVRRIGFIPELDGLRGMGALLAVSVHLYMVIIPKERQLPAELSGTFLWMDMFFVLSGFLITALLLKEQHSNGRVAFRAFWMRRGIRLLPALYVLLAVHYLFALIVDLDMSIENESVFYTSVYMLNFRMNNILTARVSEGLTQLWSLSVEEQFYLAWPLIVAFLLPLRRRLSTVVIVLSTVIVLVAARRGLMFRDADGANWFRLYTHTDTRVDSLLMGALMAYLWVHGKLDLNNRYARKAVEMAAYLSMALVTWLLFNIEMPQAFSYYGGFNLMAICFATIILACIQTDWALRPLFVWAPLRKVGEVSYGLYLWHMMVMIVVARIGSEWDPWARAVTAVAGSAGVTYLSWVLVEQPTMRFKARWDTRHDPVPTPAPRSEASTVAGG